MTKRPSHLLSPNRRKIEMVIATNENREKNGFYQTIFSDFQLNYLKTNMTVHDMKASIHADFFSNFFSFLSILHSGIAVYVRKLHAGLADLKRELHLSVQILNTLRPRSEKKPARESIYNGFIPAEV